MDEDGVVMDLDGERVGDGSGFGRRHCVVCFVHGCYGSFSDCDGGGDEVLIPARESRGGASLYVSS